MKNHLITTIITLFCLIGWGQKDLKNNNTRELVFQQTGVLVNESGEIKVDVSQLRELFLKSDFFDIEIDLQLIASESTLFKDSELIKDDFLYLFALSYDNVKDLPTNSYINGIVFYPNRMARDYSSTRGNSENDFEHSEFKGPDKGNMEFGTIDFSLPHKMAFEKFFRTFHYPQESNRNEMHRIILKQDTETRQKLFLYKFEPLDLNWTKMDNSIARNYFLNFKTGNATKLNIRSIRIYKSYKEE